MRRAGTGILAAAAGAVALVAAACGSIHQAAPGISAQAPGATASPGAAVAARYSPCARSFPGMPVGRALASLYAGSLACEFAVPPGARRLAHAPDAPSGTLEPSAPLPGAEEVDRVQYWQVPGSPQGFLAWEKRHLPHALAASASGPGYGSRGGIAFEWVYMYDLPAVPARPSPGGEIYPRTMTISAVSAGNGRADIEVQVSVGWIGPRPAAEVVPPAAHAVTIAVTPDSNLHITPPAPVTVTDPAQVRRIVALVDGLQLSPPGVFSCPSDGGATLVLTFRARPGGPALAVAEPDLEGCEWVSFTIGGKPQPSLGPPDGGMPFAESVVRIAGLPWNLSKMLLVACASRGSRITPVESDRTLGLLALLARA
jgi:hypothetical protein